uniref:Uncharacterized protein n=1 Tax=Arundo donax TaxID=35708 RepID=A0A0A9GD69_ARUDO
MFASTVSPSRIWTLFWDSSSTPTVPSSSPSSCMLPEWAAFSDIVVLFLFNITLNGFGPSNGTTGSEESLLATTEITRADEPRLLMAFSPELPTTFFAFNSARLFGPAKFSDPASSPLPAFATELFALPGISSFDLAFSLS